MHSLLHRANIENVAKFTVNVTHCMTQNINIYTDTGQVQSKQPSK